MEISENGINILKQLEGFSPLPYRDARGFSIGFGHFIRPNENFDSITLLDAEQLLKKDLIIFENNILKAIKIPLTQEMYDALVLWNYNTGRVSSKLFDLINNSAPLESILKFWTSTYISSDGVKLTSLIQRRALEAKLFASNFSNGIKNNFLPVILFAGLAFFFLNHKVGIKK